MIAGTSGNNHRTRFESARLYEVKVVSLQTADMNVLQCHTVHCISSNHHIRLRLRNAGYHCRKIGKRIVAELRYVVLRAVRLEIGNDVFAKVRREDKFFGPHGPRNAIISWTYVDRSKSTGAVDLD